MTKLQFIESHPDWSPAPIFEAVLSESPEQINRLSIRNPGRWILSRTSENIGTGGSYFNESDLSRDGRSGQFTSVFGSLEEAQAEAQRYYETFWLPAVAKQAANNERIRRQFAASQEESSEI